jgi:hypothetical protein
MDERGWGLGFVYIIPFVITFDSSIGLYLITLYLYVNASFPHRNNN